MRYCKIGAREFWFDETLIFGKCLIQLLSECLMSRFREHTATNNSISDNIYAADRCKENAKILEII